MCMHGRIVPYGIGLCNPRVSSGAYKFKIYKYNIFLGGLAVTL